MLRPIPWRMMARGCALGVLAGLLVVAFESDFPGKICEYNQATKHEDCPVYSLFPFLLIEISKTLNNYGVAITAVATIAIGFFTCTLKLATDRLWRSARDQVAAAENAAKIQSVDMNASIAIAKESADAAKRSAEIAERALIAGQRAFVSVSFEQSANHSLETGKITSWDFTPIWYNAGNTPTRNMQNHINSKIFDGPLPSEWDFPNLLAPNAPPEDWLPTPLGAAPKGVVRGQKVGGISIDHMREIIAGTKQLYMWGWASYNDVFPQTPMHVTRFSVRVLAGGDPSDRSKISFVCKFTRRYNCSDEECEHQGYPASWVPRKLGSE